MVRTRERPNYRIYESEYFSMWLHLELRAMGTLNNVNVAPSDLRGAASNPGSVIHAPLPHSVGKAQDRVQDQALVRDGAQLNDRVTMLPPRWIESFQDHLLHVQRLIANDGALLWDGVSLYT